MSNAISFVQMQTRSFHKDEWEAVRDAAISVFGSLGIILAVV